jgi:hypothetical protein
MVAIDPQQRKRCSVIAGELYEYEPQILDLEPFTPHNFRQPQRPSYGYQQPPPQPHYSQPPPQPIYYQGGPPVQQVVRGSYQLPVSSMGPPQPHYSSGNYAQGVPLYRNQP